MARKNYGVQSPLRHDGKDYEIGESIELEDKQAKSLVKDGVIAPGGAAPAGNKEPTDPAERLAAIVAAIKPLGFQWVSLDLEGYRTGSLNEILQIRSAPDR